MNIGYTLLHFTSLLLHFASRFAAFHLAFWCKMHCVLMQNALRFGAYCDAFCRKTRCKN
mgnify:CR=1 FL=1